jgi:ABC-2 type transport system permease protein
MKNLLYKEFHLAIHPLFYPLLLLCAALLMIPQWVFFLALMYFFFITVPNIFTMGKAQNDVIFSVMMPVRKRDVVKARMTSIILLELLQVLVAALFAVLHAAVYSSIDNFLLDTNIAFFGFALVMYALFNLVFFPMFYKTAYKVGIPTLAGILAALLFATGVEFAVLWIPDLQVLDGMWNIPAQLGVMAGSIVLFVLINIAAYKISAKRFERIDL